MMGFVWVWRRFYRPKTAQSKKMEHAFKWTVGILSLSAIPVGWYIYSRFEKIPLAGLALGLILGLRVILNETSRRKRT